MVIFNYSPENKFMFTIFYGAVTAQEIHQVIDKLQTIELDEGGMRGLTIFCKGSKTQDVTTRDVMDMGKRMQKVNFRNNGKNAFVTKSLLAYGLSRAFKVAMDVFSNDEMKIYKEGGLSKAMEWLGVSKMESDLDSIINDCELNKS